MLRNMMSNWTAVVLCALTTTVGAQAPDSSTPPAAPPATQAELRYAQVLVEEVAVQCFASTRSPVFADRLRQGDVVQIGEAKGAFYPVVLPLGPVGFVHKDFCSKIENGLLRTARPKVSFRYRAKSGEAPHSLMSKGTELRFLARQGDWYRVRWDQAEAWLPVKDVRAFDAATQTLQKGYADLRQRHHAVWLAGVEARAAKDQKKQRNLKFEERHKALRAKFGKITSTTSNNPAAQQQRLDKLRQAVDGMVKEIDAVLLPVKVKEASSEPNQASAEPGVGGSQPAKDIDPADRRLADLQQRLRLLAVDVRGQSRLAAAVAALNRQPKPAVEVQLPKDPGPSRSERYDAVGWLRFDGRSAGVNRFRLEKGRKLVAYVRSSSTRYDLRHFNGVEVAVRGARQTGGVPAAPLIDVDEIEVLAITERRRR